MNRDRSGGPSQSVESFLAPHSSLAPRPRRTHPRARHARLGRGACGAQPVRHRAASEGADGPGPREADRLRRRLLEVQVEPLGRDVVAANAHPSRLSFPLCVARRPCATASITSRGRTTRARSRASTRRRRSTPPTPVRSWTGPWYARVRSRRRRRTHRHSTPPSPRRLLRDAPTVRSSHSRRLPSDRPSQTETDRKLRVQAERLDRRRCEDATRRYAEEAKKVGVAAVSVDVLPAGHGAGGGDVAETITAYVASKRADLVVVGSRGIGSLQRSVLTLVGLGSVSEYLARHVDAPLLLVRTPAPSSAETRKTRDESTVTTTDESFAPPEGGFARGK